LTRFSGAIVFSFWIARDTGQNRFVVRYRTGPSLLFFTRLPFHSILENEQMSSYGRMFTIFAGRTA
jgi:hypothetical protein